MVFLQTNFDRLWEEFSIPLKNYIKRRINNNQDVEDILQTVFIKIYTNINNLNETNKLYAWIYTITRNTIMDYYRNKNLESSIECLPEDYFNEEYEENNLNFEISQCLKTMIQFLPEKYKQAIILTEFENLTQKELANKMGLSISGAKSRVQRARVLLKNMLQDCCSLELDHRGNIIDYKINNKDNKYCCKKDV